MDNNLQSFFNKRYGKIKPADTTAAQFLNSTLNFGANMLAKLPSVLPGSKRPEYIPEDIGSLEEDYGNTINLIKDIAKRADISQQTKSDQINRLAQRAQKQQAQLLSMSAQPYENFSTYMTKRAGLAAQDLIMAPQRIGTSVGEAIGSFRESAITGKPYEEVLAKNKKNRSELLYLSIPQIEQVLTKYGKGENLIKPGETLNDMLRRERESQYEMGANLGEAKDVIIQGLMGSDYGKIETPKEFETVAGITGFLFDAIVDPTNLLPGVGIGVSGTKAISRKALRTAISKADTMEDLVLSVQKAIVNGVDKKEVKKIFYTRLEEIGKKVTPAENIEVKPTKPTAEAPTISSVEPSPNVVTEATPPSEIVGETPPSTIISEKPASVSVPEEQVGTITPTAPVEPVIEAITPSVETIQQAVTPEVVPENIVNKLNSLADMTFEKDPYKLFGTKVKVKNDYGEIFEGTIHSINKSSGGDIIYDINIPALRHGERDTARFSSKNILEVDEIKTKGMNPIKIVEEIQKMPMTNFKTITVPNEVIDFLPENSQTIQELIHEGVKYFYDKNLKSEGRYEGKVLFGDKFISLPKGAKESILYHEIGHEVSDRLLDEWAKGLDLSNIFGKMKTNPSTKKVYFDGIDGMYNLGESIAQAYSRYRLEPAWLKSKHPEAYKVLDEVLSGKDIREAVESVKARTPVEPPIKPTEPVADPFTYTPTKKSGKVIIAGDSAEIQRIAEEIPSNAKSPTEQLLESPPAEKNLYEGTTNKEGMVELGAGFDPLKPLKENFEQVADPLVKTTKTIDAVVRTIDNISGGAASKAVNFLSRGETYAPVRKVVQVAGQLAYQDIANVSDYIASTMTGKLNDKITDWFSNSKRALGGVNIEGNKMLKDIMETFGDYAEIKAGTGLNTKEYALTEMLAKREEKMLSKAENLKGRKRIIPNDPTILEANGFDVTTISSLEKLGFLGQHDFKGIHAGAGKSGIVLTATGKELADAILKRTGKSQDKIDKFIANEINKRNILVVTPEIIDAVKKLPSLIDKSSMDVGFDIRQIGKYAPDEKGILRKAQEYSDEEIKRLVDDGYINEYFDQKGNQIYSLTEKGKTMRNEIAQAQFKDLARYNDKAAFASVLKKAGISVDEDLQEISRFLVNWFQDNTVALAEKIPMSEKQLQRLKTQWGKYMPKQRATLSETGLRKIIDNPEAYTKEQVALANDIYSAVKNPKELGVKVVQYRNNLAEAIRRNVDMSEDSVKVPRQWLAEAGIAYDPELRISADAKDLVETQYLKSWAFNRSTKEFSGLLTADRVGVRNVDLVNLTNRVMSKKYDAILPYITLPTDVLHGVMSKVSNTLRMNEAFESLAKHSEYVRTDLDPKYHGNSYTDVVDGIGITYKYINPEQTEYLSLAGKYVNENVLRTLQTRIDGSAQSLNKFSLDGAWSKFLRPIWYAGMTSSNLSYHAINMVTSGVNMLLHAPQLGLRPWSVAKTSWKWFKTLANPRLRREFASEIQDMIEHQIIGQENISVNSKSYGTITRGNVGAFEINKTINKVGVTIRDLLEMAPAMANMSDQLARITYYQEKLVDMRRAMRRAEYKALSPEQQADFVKQWKAKAADQAQTIIPSYIDTANALRAINEVMPLMSWGMKAYKIPYRNLMTLLGKNDLQGFGKLGKSINMTEKAKAAFTLIGLPALAGYYAYNKVQNNREQAMAEAGATPEYRNNFYDQKWCKMIPSIEDLFERQEDYLAAKYVVDAIFNRSFSFETNEGIVKVSGSNYGERYRLPEFQSPLVIYGNIIFNGTKVNPFTGSGEPITEKEGWERAKDLLTYTLFVSSASSQRYNSEVRRLKKQGLSEQEARQKAWGKILDAESLLRYDVTTQEDLIKRTKGEQYRLKKQVAGLKKMTPEEVEKAMPGIEKQGERVRVRADLIDYLPKGKE